MRAVSSPQPAFTPLNHITVNGEPRETNVKPTRTICGVKAKIVVAAVLLLLLLIILTAAIVMIAVASAKKEAKETSTSEPVQEATSSSITVPVSDRISCPLKTSSSCVKGGCLYSNVDLEGEPVSASIPKCFYPKDSFVLSSSSNIGNRTAYVTDGTVSNGTEITAKLDDSENDSLTLIINNSSNNKSKRQTNSSENSENSEDSEKLENQSNYEISYGISFGFNITRDKEVIFRLENKSSLSVMKNFISLSIAVPQYSKAYGLGEFSKLEKIFDDSIYSMWTRSDEEGAHPFILLLSKNGTASGIYIDSTYPMDITLKRDYNINIVILQTELKIRFFTGPTVADVIRQYWDVIGAPCRPPYWGLGHFYGSEKIASHKELLELIQTNHTTLGKLPVEGILLPSAMNRASLPFSYTQETRDYIKGVTDNQKMRFIVTVPPGITSSTKEETYYMDSAGIDQKVFISRTSEGDPLQGYYKNRMVKYPDFTSSNTATWWHSNLTEYSNGYGFHLHQNTPYSQINGSVGVCSDLAPDVNLATDILNLRNLEENTLCLSGLNKKGNQLELHNHFSCQQAMATQSALKPYSVSKQPLVVSDGTSPGIGAVAGHFHDSNVDNPNDLTGLKAALNEMVTFNFLGVTIVGPNICTKEYSTSEACLKWYYLSVISPLAWSLSSNLPHLFAGDDTFRQKVSTVLQFRQTLLHYHYDTLYKAHVSSEVPLRFLTFDYPTDESAGLYQDQVLFGDAILYTPILRTGEEFRVSYLPSGTWCNWVDGSCYHGPTEVKVLGSNSPASFTFLKGGTAVMTQNSANTTEASREQKVRLIVVLDESGQANSTRLFDDGDTANSLDTKYYTLVNYRAANDSLSVTLPQRGYRGGVMKMKYERILVYGLPKKVISVTRVEKKQQIRVSSLVAGDTHFYKLVVSDTNVEIELNQEFELKWELQDGHG